MKIGERIRLLRLYKNITQHELVNGISSLTYLSRIENGRIKPSQAFLKSIAPRLDVSVSDLLEGDQQEKEVKVKEICDKYKKHETISPNELAILHLNAHEMHSVEILFNLFGVLLRYYVREEQLEKADQVYRSAEELLPYENHLLSEGSSYYLMSCGNYFYAKQDFVQADKFYTMIEKGGNFKNTELGHLYFNLSVAKQRLSGDMSIPLYYLNLAYDIFKREKDYYNVGRTLITMAVQYHSKGDFLHSEKCLNEAISIPSIRENDSFLLMIEYNFGRIYQKNNKFNRAIDHFQKVLEMQNKLGSKEKVYPLRSLVQIHMAEKKWDKVNQYLQEAILVSKENDMNYLFIEMSAMKASISKIRGDVISFEKEMKHLIEFGVMHNQVLLTKKLATDLANHFYEQRAYKKSASYFKLASEIVEVTHSEN